MISTLTAAAKAIKIKAYGASGDLVKGKTLRKIDIDRRMPEDDEVLIEVLYCGVCHSDIHQVENDWKNTIYPCVPGHEIIGRIASTGKEATNFKEGDIVGVGCMINSCQHCKSCMSGEEQYCVGPVGMTMTYNGHFKPDGSGYNTYGGFSTHVTANKNFVLRIPKGMDISTAAPILCAGVTTYSPLKKWGICKGDKVGIIGIGGLGHMAVMIAKALGAEVTAITTHEDKRRAAIDLGADAVLVSEDEEAMLQHELSFDFLLCTIPVSFNVNRYVKLLSPHGNMVTVGLLAPYKEPADNMELAKYSRTIGGSLIGSVAETQEVLDFCAQHKIVPHVQLIEMDEINTAFKSIKDDEVRFRYVVDMASLKNMVQ